MEATETVRLFEEGKYTVCRFSGRFLGTPRKKGTHRTRKPRGEEFGFGGKLREFRDIAAKRAAWEVVLEDLWGDDGVSGWEHGKGETLIGLSPKPPKATTFVSLACIQWGSLSTCRIISCPASSNPRSRPPMPEKRDTVFMTVGVTMCVTE